MVKKLDAIKIYEIAEPGKTGEGRSPFRFDSSPRHHQPC